MPKKMLNAKMIPELMIKIALGGSAIIFVILIYLALLGGIQITRTIDPNYMKEASSTIPGWMFTKKIPVMGWSTILSGGLITPSQISVLENHLPLPNGKCSLAGIYAGNNGCYFANVERIYFISSDKTSPKTNGKSYEIAWRWKPSPFLLSINALILFYLT